MSRQRERAARARPRPSPEAILATVYDDRGFGRIEFVGWGVEEHVPGWDPGDPAEEAAVLALLL